MNSTTKPHASCCVASMVASLALASAVLETGAAGVIDFEEINMSVPQEGLSISNQFQPYFGILFRRSKASLPFPVIAKAGLPQTAFTRQGNIVDDTPGGTNAPIFGQYFLTDTVGDGGGTDGGYLIWEFVTSVSRVSGYILDIDNDEEVNLIAFSDIEGLNQIIGLTIRSGQPGTGDGVGTFWEFNRPTKEIRRIEIHHRRPNGDGAPLGYDLIASDYTPSLSQPQLSLYIYPGIRIDGILGHRYQVDYADRFDVAPGATNWHVLTTNLFLPTTSYLFMDTNAPNSDRFYRAIAVP